MLSTALALATLTIAGLLVLYGKLPRRIRKLIEKHSLLSDFLALLGIYLLLGGTLTALIAASMCGLMISILLHIANNPDDYLLVYDARNMIKEKIVQAKKKLEDFNEAYKIQKAKEAAEAE